MFFFEKSPLTIEPQSSGSQALVETSALTSVEAISALANYLSGQLGLKCEPVSLSIRKGSSLVATGFFFEIKTRFGPLLVSGGRFGYAGLRVVDPRLALEPLMLALRTYLSGEGYAIASVAVHGTKIRLAPGVSSWAITNVDSYVAEVNESCTEGKLSFANAKKRSSLSRSVRKAESMGIRVVESASLEDLEVWHSECHIPRMDEIGGNPWPLVFFRQLLSTNQAVLFKAESQLGNILGGCFVIKSIETSELIMMSSKREEQQLGVNHLISKHIYLEANSSGRKYVNWQASNPPIGSIVRFKESWNARPFRFQILSSLLDCEVITESQIKTEFPDTFIFPFTELGRNR